MILKATLGSFLILGAVTPGIVALDTDDAPTSYERFTNMLAAEGERDGLGDSAELFALALKTVQQHEDASEPTAFENAKREQDEHEFRRQIAERMAQLEEYEERLIDAQQALEQAMDRGEERRAAELTEHVDALESAMELMREGMAQARHRAEGEQDFTEHARQMEELEMHMQELHGAYERAREEGDFQRAEEFAAELHNVEGRVNEMRRDIEHAHMDRSRSERDDDDIHELDQHIEELSGAVNELESELNHARHEGEEEHANDVSNELERVVHELRATHAMREEVVREHAAMRELDMLESANDELEMAIDAALEQGHEDQAARFEEQRDEVRTRAEHARHRVREAEQRIRGTQVEFERDDRASQMNEFEMHIVEMTERIEHMHAAMQQLEEAGMPDAAEQVEREIHEHNNILENMRRELDQAHREHERAVRGNQSERERAENNPRENREHERGHREISEAIEALRDDMRELREIVHQLNRRLDEMQDRRERQ